MGELKLREGATEWREVEGQVLLLDLRQGMSSFCGFAGAALGARWFLRRPRQLSLTGYVDLEGAAIRVASDYLEGVAPIIARYATLGIA